MQNSLQLTYLPHISVSERPIWLYVIVMVMNICLLYYYIKYCAPHYLH